MDQARQYAITNLRALLFLSEREEERLRLILEDDPPFRFKMRTRTDLERVIRNRKNQSDELANLEAEREE